MWIPINNQQFNDCRAEIEKLSVDYDDTWCDNAEDAMLEIRQANDQFYIKTVAQYIHATHPESGHPACNELTQAAAYNIIGPLLDALDAKAAQQDPKWKLPPEPWPWEE